MAIFGIEGGIGTGKTLSLVTLGIEDYNIGRTIYTNVALKIHGERVIFLTKDKINSIFELVKTHKLKMKNSTVLLQECHNYMDSRSSMSAKNRTLTYWILQSRHTGAGSSDIIYDTQDFGQVDKRLRMNTDYFIRPHITSWTGTKPDEILLMIEAKIGHRWARMTKRLDVRTTRDMYDTHEIVDF